MTGEEGNEGTPPYHHHHPQEEEEEHPTLRPCGLQGSVFWV
jgi:hypothetical protein